MQVVSAKFIGSFTSTDQVPSDDLTEIAFCGRSNVGKSSLINCLLNRKNLAHTSSTPGKTRQLNFYCINDSYYFVDLPGYGFANVSQTERRSWKILIESYFKKNGKLAGIVQIIDSRQGITALDQEMLQWLHYLRLPVVVVATKADKLCKSQKTLRLKIVSKEAQKFQAENVIGFSRLSKEGKKEIWQAIDKFLSLSKE